MVQRLKGRSAVVTGGGGDIGKGIAKALAAEGAKVVVNDPGKDSDDNSLADKVVKEITKAKGIAVANYDSVATMSGGQNIVKTAMINFSRIDILVNCAANFRVVPFSEMNEKDWNSIIDVHLKGHFSCCKAAVPEMTKQKRGRIINFSSRGPFFLGGNLAYATAKAGIIGFSTGLAQEVKEYGITVNSILPSAITKLFPGKKMPIGDNIPVPQDAGPEFVAPLVVYLATDEAKDITGRSFYAGGGDICVYAQPFQITAAHRFIHKKGKWTVDELIEAVPPQIALP